MIPIRRNQQNADVSVFRIPPILPPWQIRESFEHILLLLFPEVGTGARMTENVDFGVRLRFKLPLFHLLFVGSGKIRHGNIGDKINMRSVSWQMS